MCVWLFGNIHTLVVFALVRTCAVCMGVCMCVCVYICEICMRQTMAFVIQDQRQWTRPTTINKKPTKPHNLCQNQALINRNLLPQIKRKKNDKRNYFPNDECAGA